MAKKISILHAVLFILLFTVLTIVQQVSLPQRGHTQHIQSANFEYLTTLYPRHRAPRCLLLRCSLPKQPQTSISTSCDTLKVVVQKAKRNLTARHCVSDFLLEHWSALKGGYVHGIAYASNHVLLETDARNLPFRAESISVSMDEQRRALSTQWLSFRPSNRTRELLRVWLKSAQKHPSDASKALSQIRSCAGSDISCHSRVGIVGATCTMPLRCGNGNLILKNTLVALFGLLLVQTCIWIMRGMVVAVEVVVGCVLAMSVLRMRWTSAACTIASGLLCRCKQRLMAGGSVEGSLYEGGLRGWYEGRAYILRDGVYEVRVTGGLQPLFPGAFSAYMGVRRAVGEWAVFASAAALLVFAASFRGGVALLKLQKKGEDVEEYASEKEIRALRRSASGRRFLGPSARA